MIDEDIISSPRPIILPQAVISYFGELVASMSNISATKEKSTDILRSIWIRIATKLVEQYIEKYNISKEDATILKKMYLKPNHYYIIIN